MKRTLLLLTSSIIIVIVGIFSAQRLFPNFWTANQSSGTAQPVRSVPTWTPTPGPTPIPIPTAAPTATPTVTPSTLTADAYYAELHRHIDSFAIWISEYEELSRLPVSASSRWAESEPEWRKRMIALTQGYQDDVSHIAALLPPSDLIGMHNAIVEAFEICNVGISEIQRQLEDPSSTEKIFPIPFECNLAFMDLLSYLQERSLLGN